MLYDIMHTTRCGIMPAEYVGVCCRCGHALTQKEICAELQGRYTDFIDRIVMDMDLVLCIDCNNAVKEIMVNGLEPAIKKRELVVRDDRWAVKQVPPFEYQGDDDTPIP